MSRSPIIPSRRDLILGGAAAAAGIAAYAGMPRRALKSIPDNALDRVIPLRIGDWNYETSSGLILPPPDQLARLVYNQQLTRTYGAPERPTVMMLMAYGSTQGGMLQIHRPEVCYPASGFRLSDASQVEIPVGPGHAIPARFFSAHSPTRSEQVLYWTRIGRRLPGTWVEQRLAVVRSNLEGYIPDGLLVRFSLLSDDAGYARPILADFIRTMFAEMPVARRRMLVADAGG